MTKTLDVLTLKATGPPAQYRRASGVFAPHGYFCLAASIKGRSCASASAHVAANSSGSM